MIDQRLTIITSSTGHKSIAQAIAASIPAKYLIALDHIETNLFNLYTPFYYYFPQLFKIPYKLSAQKQAFPILKKTLHKLLGAQIEARIAATRPTIVISTWYPANPSLEILQPKYGYKLVNIVTDPRTIHGLIPTNQGHNFVFDQKTAKTCGKLGIDKQNITVSGWFVRKEFETNYSQTKVKKELDLDPSQPMYLVVAGSEGTNLVLKILPTFINAKSASTVVFACGHNHNLYNILKNMNKFAGKIPHNFKATLIPLPFRDDIHLYIKAADLVIGKAGPNLIFESAAALTPFFAITHITGQEDGNLNLISEYKLGYVEENTIKANKLISQIINNPKKVKKSTSHLEKIRRHNLQAKDILIRYISAL